MGECIHRQRLLRLRQRLEEELQSLDPDVLRLHPLESYVQQLDRWEQRQAYHFVPMEVDRECERIAARSTKRGLELYHKLLLIWLIEQYEERSKRHRIPESIGRLIPEAFDRILTGIEHAENGYFLHGNELFAKDLGLCRLKLLPCGAEVVDVWSGIPRSMLLRGGVSQSIQGAVFVARLGGFKPLYESHWDRRLIRRFRPEEYDLCYVRIAHLLQLNPQMRGMFGSSWWFDPIINEIAPELLFLRQTPIENGARVFRVGTDAGAVRDAIQFSKKRKALYESGRFTPCRYMLVWARDDMLAWAGRHEAGGSQNR